MTNAAYIPVTAEEVAAALCISDCDELTGESIAQEMLNGLIEFTDYELKEIAKFKNITVSELLERDERFKALCR